MAEASFGTWVKEERERAGWTQGECAERVTDYYEREEAHLAPADRTTFSRSAWTKMETAKTSERVFPKTVLQASIGLRLPFEQCMAVAGYTVDHSPDDASVTIGRNITRIRQQVGMSIEQAAAVLSIPVERYQLYESGKASPDAAQVVQLSTILGVSVNQIFEGRAGTGNGTSIRPIASSSSVTKADITALHQKLDAILHLLEQDQKQAG